MLNLSTIKDAITEQNFSFFKENYESIKQFITDTPDTLDEILFHSISECKKQRHQSALPYTSLVLMLREMGANFAQSNILYQAEPLITKAADACTKVYLATLVCGAKWNKATKPHKGVFEYQETPAYRSHDRIEKLLFREHLEKIKEMQSTLLELLTTAVEHDFLLAAQDLVNFKRKKAYVRFDVTPKEEKTPANGARTTVSINTFAGINDIGNINRIATNDSNAAHEQQHNLVAGLTPEMFSHDGKKQSMQPADPMPEVLIKKEKEKQMKVFEELDTRQQKIDSLVEEGTTYIALSAQNVVGISLINHFMMQGNLAQLKRLLEAFPALKKGDASEVFQTANKLAQDDPEKYNPILEFIGNTFHMKYQLAKAITFNPALMATDVKSSMHFKILFANLKQKKEEVFIKYFNKNVPEDKKEALLNCLALEVTDPTLKELLTKITAQSTQKRSGEVLIDDQKPEKKIKATT